MTFGPNTSRSTTLILHPLPIDGTNTQDRGYTGLQEQIIVLRLLAVYSRSITANGSGISITRIAAGVFDHWRSATFCVCYTIPAYGAGFHALRRFRAQVLRRARVPEDLIGLWLGHARRTVTDLYAAGLEHDLAWRKEWAERAGLGFTVGPQTLFRLKLRRPRKPMKGQKKEWLLR